ncbi:hypothetical protein EZV62_000868 [Acer yangbiense]|uniref:RING-type E3 ubiquitin transferase n=1 Tax=Acer yangbiense TaxID=1000413 RepID=A0A5C7IT59_9ROSI|nr:hypothetical protein EZV62_000868 [Acer yangbiense]
MDLVGRKFMIHGSSSYSSQSQNLSPITSPEDSILGSHLHSSDASFPIIAIAIIGILATTFLLVSYYIFVIKCCLNWHRIDLLRRFSLSWNRRHEVPLMIIAPSSSPQDPSPYTENVSSDEDHVVIELGNHHSADQTLLATQEREKDDQFAIQPIRRSFSMDSSADPKLYLAIQEAVQSRQVSEVSSPIEGCSSRVRRSFFTFGHGRGSRSAVLPLHLEP